MLRGVFAESSPVAACADPGAALGPAPGGRVVLGSIVERPVTRGAGFQVGPTSFILRREHDQDQPADGMVLSGPSPTGSFGGR